MAVDQVGNAVPAPGHFTTPYSTDDELLYSTARFTQKGITLKTGQGLVLMGTVMGIITATQRWVPYATGNSNGSQVARGVLRTNVETGTDAAGHEYQGNLVIGGMLKLAKIIGADAGALTALDARTDSVFGYFSF
jgi:hypothetical protein